MKSLSLRAPNFLLPPATKKQVDIMRFNIDVIGMCGIYLFGPFIPPTYQWIVSLYSFLAWLTILTVDPSRLPEATTTRKYQRRAFKMGLICLPFYVLIFYFSFFLASPYQSHQFLSMGVFLGLVINAVLYETYFRNIVQVVLRKWGLPAWVSILVQSLLFGLMFYTKQPIEVSIGSFAIGLINGWISYKTRSLQWGILIMVIWLICINSL
jgi:hypothetical protein